MDILNNIKTIRQVKKLSQETVASRLNMEKSGYSKIERGETELTWTRFREICKVFEMQEVDVIAFDPERKSLISEKEEIHCLEFMM